MTILHPMRYAMIMAGGAGTRLWPLSRLGRPKQLLPFIERPGRASASLLELAANRLDGLVGQSNRYICTGESYRAAIRESLPSFTDERILGEPMGRDTVNAVGFAAAVFAKQDPDAVFAVLTADHIIEPQDVFHARMDLGFRLVEEDPSRLVTFGIKPTYPATGYGYIERARPIPGTDGHAYQVARFVEKPDAPRAQAYVESGNFGWNSGMFVFHAGTVLSCLQRFKPECAKGLRKIQDAWGTPDQPAVLNEVYPSLPKVSVDYAIMEPASDDEAVSIVGVEMDLTWLDVGSWPSYAETLDADGDGNRSSGAAELVSLDSTGNLVVLDSECDAHTVALLGCNNLIVVKTPDATLVMPRDRAQDLKSLHERTRNDLK